MSYGVYVSAFTADLGSATPLPTQLAPPHPGPQLQMNMESAYILHTPLPAGTAGPAPTGCSTQLEQPAERW